MKPYIVTGDRVDWPPSGIEWYYSDRYVAIAHSDCREILPSLPKVDLVLTDPPYGIHYKGGKGGNLIHSSRQRKQEVVTGDDQPFEPSILFIAPHVAMFGAQHYYSRLPEGGTFHVWDKRGGYLPVHTSDFDTLWVNRKEVGRIERCVWRGLCRETEYDQRIEHPTQKPLRVMTWAIEMFPNAHVILDPFMGSGTTLRAAKDLGRKAIGIEIEEKYCEIAATRCNDAQPALIEALERVRETQSLILSCGELLEEG